MTRISDQPVSRVIIIGAGPSGLLLARYLQLHQVPCAIYERDASPAARTQGGSLDLHETSGLAALRGAELLNQARELMRPEGEAMRILDDTGKVWWNEAGPDVGQDATVDVGGRPEIDR